MNHIQDLNRKSKSDLVEIAESSSLENSKLSEALKLEKKKVEALFLIMNAESPHKFLTALLEGIPDWNFQAIRLIIDHEDYFQEKVKVGVGDYSDNFSYLDQQIDEQLGGKDLLEIRDTSKIHNFIFESGKAYPKSIYAFPIISQQKKIGFLWMADERPHAFSHGQLQRMRMIIKELSLSLAFFADIVRQKQITTTLQYAMDAMEDPIFLIDGQNNLIIANKLAEKTLQIDGGFEGKHIPKELLVKIHAKDKEFTFRLSNKTYKAFRREIVVPGQSEKYFMYYIKDVSLQQKKDDFLKTVINALAGNISNELGAIKGFVNLVENLGQLSPKQNDYLGSIRKTEERIQAKLHDLLSVDRLKSENIISPVEIDLRALITKIAGVFKPLLIQKQLDLCLNLPEKEALIISDEGLVEMLVLYLIDSSVQEAPMESVISFTLEHAAENSILIIKDRGIGLSKPDIDGILNREGKKVENKNLQIAKAISDLLMGEFSIESKLGEGKSIRIALPMIK